MQKVFLLTLTILMLGAVSSFGTENFSVGQNLNFADAQEVDAENFAEEVLQLVNVERGKVGLKPLELSPGLMRAADVRVNELPENFSHTRPDGSSCFTAIKISYRAVGENIAAGQPTPAQVVESWMQSPGHRANILNKKFGKLGVGYLYTDKTEYKHYWVQLFKN